MLQRKLSPHTILISLVFPLSSTLFFIMLQTSVFCLVRELQRTVLSVCDSQEWQNDYTVMLKIVSFMHILLNDNVFSSDYTSFSHNKKVIRFDSENTSSIHTSVGN
jgi:hypothetical protein